ncbi:MAG: hypothetical protein JW765_01895 [Deltaproteobacteria bacterium]|nr:hypothetical protein [Candidatus Zymogenaceae bacterium]
MKRVTCALLLVIMIGVLPRGAVFGIDTGGCFAGADRSTCEEILTLVNRERGKNNLPPLGCDGALSAIAQNHAEDMAGRRYFKHISPDGRSPFDRLAEAGIHYRRAGENIALNREGAHSVVKLWMRSSGHRKNILGDFTKAGVGSYRGYHVLLLIKE